MTRLVWFAIAWVAGILLAQAAHFPLIWMLLCIPAALVLWVGWRDSQAARRAAAILLGLVLGSVRLALSEPLLSERHIATYNDAGGAIGLIGVIIQEPDIRATHTQVVVRSTQVILADGELRDVEGRALAWLPAHTGISYGDEIELHGSLSTPPESGEFSYRRYLAQRSIHSLMEADTVLVLSTHQANPVLGIILKLKARAHAVILTALPEPQASLLAGILLGIESGIPEELIEAFRVTGTSHIVAISGFNLTLVAGVFVAIAQHIGKKRHETPIALAGIWIYTVLVGAAAAVARAAVMASLAVIARCDQRSVHGPTSLAGAAFLMSLVNPYILWDVGFQLSLAATLGIMLYTDPLSAALARLTKRGTGAEKAQRATGALSDALIVTLAAQITTTPILAAHFGRLSLITLASNLLVLPAQPFVMLFGGVTVLVGLVALLPAQLLGWLAWVFLSYTILIVQRAAELPFAQISLSAIAPSVVWAYYAILFGLTWVLSTSPRRRKALWDQIRALPGWQKATAVAVPLLLAAAVAMLPDRRLHVTFLDVGLGDATLIQTPAGQHILIDGGPNGATTLAQIGKRLPFWKRTLDLVILTSPDRERIEGLIPVMERYRVAQVASSSETAQSSAFRRWQELLDARAALGNFQVTAGYTWHLGSGVDLRVLWPYPDSVPGPLVLQLVYGETQMLIAGDATTLIEDGLVAAHGQDLESQVLQLPRHGAQTSGTPAFLQAVSPEIVVITTAAERAYPSPYALARLMGIPVYQTDIDGTIEVISDGATLRVRTEGR